MKASNVRMMVEISLMVAVAMLLSMLKFWQMPYGGSVSLEMLPILILAFRHGGPIGILGGFLLGALKLLVSPYLIHPVQVILDYPLPYAILGVAGFGILRKKPYFAIVVATLLRFIVHVTSGVVFFAEYAPEGMPVLLYSMAYNGAFILPEMLIVIVIFIFFNKRRDLFAPHQM